MNSYNKLPYLLLNGKTLILVNFRLEIAANLGQSCQNLHLQKFCHYKKTRLISGMNS